MARLDDVTNLVAGGISLEIVFDGRNGLGFVGLVVSDKFRELLFQEIIPGLEARNEPEDFFEDFAECESAIHTRGFP